MATEAYLGGPALPKIIKIKRKTPIEELSDTKPMRQIIPRVDPLILEPNGDLMRDESGDKAKES